MCMASNHYNQPVRDYQLSEGVVAAIRRTREYRLGFIDGKAETAAEVELLKENLAAAQQSIMWHARRLEEADMMLDSVKNAPPSFTERLMEWRRNNSVLVSVLAVVGTVALFNVVAGWLA